MNYSILTKEGNLTMLTAYNHCANTFSEKSLDFFSFRAGFVDGLRAVPKIVTEAGYDRVKDLLNE